MFNRKPAESTLLDDVINDALRSLKGHEEHTAAYAQIVDQLTKLHELKKDGRPDRLSKDTLALVLGNLAGIFVIVGHERAHIVTSKALSLIRAAK